VPGERLDDLKLPPMYVNNEDPKGTAFTVSTDYKHGTTTGISAADRALTFKALADPQTTAADFLRPGHVFPLRPKPGGVCERDGHTEAVSSRPRRPVLPSATPMRQHAQCDTAPSEHCP
jgi:3,4-dihydroxy-2-butanone 4-phosphate synthase